MNIKIVFGSLIIFIGSALYAAEHQTDPKLETAGLLQNESLKLQSQSMKSTSAGLLIQSDRAAFISLYSVTDFSEPARSDFPEKYHTIDLLLDAKKNNVNYIGIFKSASDKPITGGLHTYQAAAVAGYEFMHTPSTSIVLGGGLALGDFGIKTSGGKTWPLLPVPLIRINYTSDIVDSAFEFLTSPNLSVTLFPSNQFRLTGDIRFDQLRDTHDILYDFSVGYRFFNNDSKYGDFAGIAVGTKNVSTGEFMVSNLEQKETLEVQSQMIFLTLDLSILTLSAGHVYNNQQRYSSVKKTDLGDGNYVSVQAIIPL